MPVVIGSGARLATVTPASPTTLVNAPSPMIWAPSFFAVSAAISSREYVNSGLCAISSRGVPPTVISQPSASAPVGEVMPVTWL